MVTRLEQINPDGTPKEGLERWLIEVSPLREFSLSAYIKALFTANPGLYRIIVFIITPHPLYQKERSVSRDEATAWLSEGSNKLPKSVHEQAYSNEYNCTALIYEFERPSYANEAHVKIPGRLSGTTHLLKAKLWGALKP